MASVLARLADAASRRRRLVIGAWLALLVGGAWFSLHQSDRLSGGGWDVPGSASVRVSDELDAFPDFSSPALSVLVTGRSPAAVQKRLAAVRATAGRDPALRPNRPRPCDTPAAKPHYRRRSGTFAEQTHENNLIPIG